MSNDAGKKFIDLLTKFLQAYFEAISRIMAPQISVSIRTHSQDSLDDRIKKIDIARENLIEGLNAIEQLKLSAENNKKEVEEALAALKKISGEKASAEQELQNIKQLMQADATTFKKLLGLPGAKEIWRERIIGFVSGILASVIASGVVYVLAYGWDKIAK